MRGSTFRLRRLGWKTTLAVCLTLALGGAVALDGVRVARSARSTGEDPQANSAQKMVALITRGEMPHDDFPAELGERFGWKLKPGDAAPDFVLPRIDQPAEVSLSSFRGKPVVLAFGSMTCDLFCGDLAEVQRLQREYGDRAQFLFVNVTEAGHSIEGFEFLLEGREPDPRTVRGREGRPRTPLPQRRGLLMRATEKLNMTLPGVIDVDGTVEAAYDSFPRRLVVVDADGRIAVDLGKGLLSSWNVKAVEDWLKAHPGQRERRLGPAPPRGRPGSRPKQSPAEWAPGIMGGKRAGGG